MVDEKKKLVNVKTPIFRASFIHIWQPQTQEDEQGNPIPDAKPVYSVEAIFDPNAQHTMPDGGKITVRQALKEIFGPVIEAATKTGIEKKWKGKTPAQFGDKFHSPFREGTKQNFTMQWENRPEIHGMIICGLRSYGRQPGVVKYNGGQSPAIITDQSELYPGCYCIASVSAFPYLQKGNAGISLGLNNLMKIKDGEPLTNMIKAERDFAEIAAVNPEYFGIDNSEMFDDPATLASLGI